MISSRGKGGWLIKGLAVILLASGGTWSLMLSSRAVGGEVVAPEAAQACVDCHQARHLSVAAIRDWKASKHAESGVGCNLCHIPAEDAPEAVRNEKTRCENPQVRRSVSPRNCTPCHPTKVESFAQGKHALAWVAMNAMPTTAEQPAAIIEGEKGCGGCHRIGRDEGKCDSCHTRHRFAAAEARKPQACQTCHMGFDHPQWEMYSTSKHGSIYAIEGQNWDWNFRLGEWFLNPYDPLPGTPRAPTCAFCHLPDGDHEVRTAWGFLAVRLAEKDPEWQGYRNTIFRGLGVIDEQGNPTDRFQVVAAGQVARLTAEDWQAQRQRMIDRCSKCHNPSFAQDQMDRGDQVLKASDRLMAEAVETVEGLYRDGLLERPKDRPLNIDLLRFYQVDNPLEQKLYVMFMEHRMRAFQGAFHLNPDYMHWYGWAEMKRDLAEIKHEAALLRKAH